MQATMIKNIDQDVLPTGSSGSLDTIPRIWDDDAPHELLSAVDTVLEYMIKHNISPNICLHGNVAKACVEALQSMQFLVPDHLHEDLNKVFDYIILWLADYSEASGIVNVDLTISLGGDLSSGSFETRADAT